MPNILDLNALTEEQREMVATNYCTNKITNLSCDPCDDCEGCDDCRCN